MEIWGLGTRIFLGPITVGLGFHADGSSPCIDCVMYVLKGPLAQLYFPPWIDSMVVAMAIFIHDRERKSVMRFSQ